ncbi:AGAP010811-PA-like protein [Anopheles sinensis]|uniref:AGAP010811-PA-like protein n=1 Tax=Anopheles sinensis TaxID=74873 RepID=A0A084W3P8_ANOSI|nr:AGAP010811-PA-like protein [Anopheles sinensis]
MTEQTLHVKLLYLEKTVQAKDDTLQEVLQTLKGMKASFHDQLGELRNKTIEKIIDFPLLIGLNNSSQNISFNGQQTEAEKIVDTQTVFIENETEIVVTTPLIPVTRPKRILAYRSCKEVPTNVSGKYQIKIPDSPRTAQVYCEQEAFGGGWVVFQHRFNGEVDFFRNWSEYRDGFGDLDGEFWLGLEYLHELTSVRRNELIVEVRDYEGNYGYERYKEFMIGSESDKYSLKIGGYKGTAGDSLFYHQGMKFSTKDSDNDASDRRHCAEATGGAWWYNACSESNLNGPYANTTDDWKSLHWRSLKDDGRAMVFSRMMFRAVT